MMLQTCLVVLCGGFFCCLGVLCMLFVAVVLRVFFFFSENSTLRILNIVIL